MMMIKYYKNIVHRKITHIFSVTKFVPELASFKPITAVASHSRLSQLTVPIVR